MTVQSAPQQARAHWGFAGFLVGLLALVTAMLVISGVFIEPHQSAAASIGQFAAEIRQSAKLALQGASLPQAQTTAMDTNAYLAVLTPILAAIAVVLGGVSMYLHEPVIFSKYAIAFGVSAIAMQFVFWLALLVCGVLLMATIISNIGGILGE